MHSYGICLLLWIEARQHVTSTRAVRWYTVRSRAKRNSRRKEGKKKKKYKYKYKWHIYSNEWNRLSVKRNPRSPSPHTNDQFYTHGGLIPRQPLNPKKKRQFFSRLNPFFQHNRKYYVVFGHRHVFSLQTDRIVYKLWQVSRIE